MSRNIPAGLIEISTALAAEGIGHEIVIATPKHLARASASGFCGRPSKSKSVLLGLLRNGGFW
jgi:hypothetical protein